MNGTSFAATYGVIGDVCTECVSIWPKSALKHKSNPSVEEEMEKQKSALVCGAGGFIGSHLVKRLKREGYWVRGVDLKYPEFSPTAADDFVIGDLRDQNVCKNITDRKFDELYQLAADMGGAGYIFSGNHDADVMHNSATINLNMADRARATGLGQGLLFVFCVYVS